MAADEGLIVFTSINEEDLAEDLIMELLDRDLITSATVFPNVKLYYKWQDTINKDDEFKIMLKTTPDKYPGIEQFIRENHHYLAPEIVRLDVAFGSPEFRAFIQEKFKRAEQLGG